MLEGNDLKLAMWYHLAERDPADISDHDKALCDVLLSGAYGYGQELNKTKVKAIRGAIAARTGEAKAKAILPDWVEGNDDSGYRIKFPAWVLELPEPEAREVKVDYATYTKAVLYEMAKARGLAVITRMTKAEIVAALEAAD